MILSLLNLIPPLVDPEHPPMRATIIRRKMHCSGYRVKSSTYSPVVVPRDTVVNSAFLNAS